MKTNKLKTVKKIGQGLFFGSIAYVTALCGLSYFSHIGKEKITSQEKLEQIIEIERKRIDPNNNFIISGGLVSKNQARSDIVRTNEYKITLGGHGADVSGVRHELYHILDGHFKNIKPGEVNRNLFKYLFYFEPQAVIYESMGIKL